MVINCSIFISTRMYKSFNGNIFIFYSFWKIINTEVFKIIYLKVIDKQGQLKFKEQGKKLSVSIATKSITSSLIHSALNIKSSGCPIEVSSLNDMNIYDIKDLAKEIMQRFASEVDDIKLATTKVRGVF